MTEPLGYCVDSEVLNPLRNFIARLIDRDGMVDTSILSDVVSWCINTEEYTPKPLSAEYIRTLYSETERCPILHSDLIQQVSAAKEAIYKNIWLVDHEFDPTEPHHLIDYYHVVVIRMIL